MMRMLMVLCLVGPMALIAQDERVTGEVKKVVLYRGQALVTRVIPVQGDPGEGELVVGDLPEQILPTSLFAEADSGIAVRAVRYRTRAVGEAPREEVRALDRRIEEVQEEIGVNQSNQDLVRRRVTSLDRLDAFVAPTSQVEIAKGVLNAETLTQLVLFGFEQREKANEELLALEKARRELDRTLNLLNRQRAELAESSSKMVREAMVFLDKRGRGRGELRLSYLVGGCGWQPGYNLRAGEGDGTAELEYNAVIQQMSGEDWSGVTLALSTATPFLSSEAPGLAPFAVTLSRGQPGQSGNDQQRDVRPQAATERFQSILGRVQIAQQTQQAAVSFEDNTESSWGINLAANDYQCFELLEGKEILSSVMSGGPGSAEGPSLSYELEGPVSLASRSDQQMVRIARLELPSRFYHVATPLLTSYVYREAELRNDSGQDLLEGPVNVYLAGRFVGRGEIGSVARGQSVVVGLGADPQLRARRELVSKEEKVQGGNQVITMSIRLVIENYRGTPVPVRVLDRLPYSEREGDLRVTLDRNSDELSTDELYVRVEKPKGILRWLIEVPANASGAKARLVDYVYTLEFDRNLSLSAFGTPDAGRFRQEFEKLQRKRFNR